MTKLGLVLQLNEEVGNTMPEPRAVSRSTQEFRQAVVIGGSIAGTLAGAALARHFDKVIIVERDSLPAGPEQRAGTPHAHHFHSLLAGGVAAFERVLPGFREEYISNGAIPIIITSDMVRREAYGWRPRWDSDLGTLHASRPLIEWTARSLAERLPNLEYRTRTAAVGLSVDDGTVTGVHARDEETGTNSLLRANLVVDASGWRSKASAWLTELGYPTPKETGVDAHWGYSSVFVRVPEGWDPGYRGFYSPPLGGEFPVGGKGTRGCAYWVQEGDRRWIFTAQGAGGDYPPRDEQSLREWVSSIGAPEIDEALSNFEFMSPVQMWRETINRRLDYANLERRPESFVLLGDAVAAFNPVYGQGMAVSGVGAVVLDNELAKQEEEHGDSLVGFAERFQRLLDAKVDYCWSASTGFDFKVPGVELTVDGELQEIPKTDSGFTDWLVAYVARDRELYMKFIETNQLLHEPDWLRSPELVSAIEAEWEVLGEAIKS